MEAPVRIKEVEVLIVFVIHGSLDSIARMTKIPVHRDHACKFFFLFFF